MYQNHSSYALIINQGKPIGIFTERDLVAIAHSSTQSLREKPIGEIMTHPVITLGDDGDHTLTSLLHYLNKTHIRHLPITDRSGQLLGMITLNGLRRILEPADLLQMRRVGDLNLRLPLTAFPDTSVALLAQQMSLQQRSCVVITQPPTTEQPWRMTHQTPIGIVTERDIVQFMALELALETIPARQAMSSPLIPAFVDMTLWEVKQMMENHHIRRLVVLGEQRNLVGVITQMDLMQALDPLEMLRTIEALRQSEAEKAKALRSSQASLAAAQRVNQVGSWELDLQQQTFQGFEETLANFGIDPDRSQVPLSHWENLLHPDDRLLWQTTIEQASQSQQCFQLDLRLGRPDGSLRYLELRGEPLLNAEGHPNSFFGTLLDISSRKVAAAAIEAREHFLRSIYDGIDVGILIVQVQPGNRFIYQGANPAYERLAGLQEATLLGKSPVEVWDQARSTRAIQAFERCCQERQRVTYEECHTQSGQDCYWFNSLSPLFNSEGEVDQIITTVNNITAQKQREQALQLIVEGTASTTGTAFFRSCVYFLAQALGVRYAMVAQVTVPDGSRVRMLALWEADHWGDEVECLTQDTPCFPTLHGKPCHVPTQVQTLYPKAMYLKYWQVDSYMGIPLHHSSGTIMGCLAVLDTHPLELDRDQALILKIFAARVAAELERQQVADALAASEHQYRDLVETADCIILRWDVRGRIRFINDYGQHFFGYSSEELLGRSVLGTIVPPVESTGRDLSKLIADVCSQPSLYHTNENENLKKNGDRVWIAWSNKPIFDPLGNLIEILSVGSNITPRKEAETALERHNLALQKATQEAEAANRVKGEFLANMSHELRTPLNAILGFSQLLARDKNLSPDHLKKLKIINNSGEHLLRLINDVLEMSKIEAGQSQVHLADCHLEHLLSSLQQMFSLKADSKHIHLRFCWDQLMPKEVITDEGKLRQVLINLLGNAIKFTDRGSVTLTVTTLETTNTTCILRFQVADTGSGIAPEDQGLIFQSFVQSSNAMVSSSSGAQETGTGLGLAISQRYMHLLGSEIQVTSTLGQGTCFSFDLAVTVITQDRPPIPHAKTRRVVGLRSGQPTYRILVVEDRWENRDFLVQLLEAVGFEVETAVNGREAIAHWEQWHPHLICMDMRMPVMDGYEATRQIKARSQALDSPPTCIIALTASALEEERSLVLAAGCDDFLRKPFQESVLFEKIAHHLQVEYQWDDDPWPEAVSLGSISSLQDGSREAGASGSSRGPVDLRQSLAQLPPDWVAQLHQGAILADEEAVLALVEPWRDQYPEVVQEVENLVRDFRYEEIMLAATPGP